MVKLGTKILGSDLKRCFDVLDDKDRRYLIYIVGIQISIGIFDLLSIGLMGIVGALAISGVQSQRPTSQVNEVLSLLRIENSLFQNQIAVLALLTAFLLVIKTLFSLYFSRRVIFYLSAKGARVSAGLIQEVARLPLSEINRFSQQSLLFAISAGVNVVLIGVIAAACNLLTDLSLLIMLTVALFIIDPVIAILSILIFGSTAIILYIATRKRAIKFGRINSEMNIASNTSILNLFALYRELTVRNRKSDYVSKISTMRVELARAIAEINFMPNLSKYIMEITLVIGAFMIVGVELLLQDAVGAAGALAVFLTAATRITPALLRVQQSATGIKNSLGVATPTLDILRELNRQPLQNFDQIEKHDNKSQYPRSEIFFNDISFQYSGSHQTAISNLTVSIERNEMIALVGPSGSGKSTFVDLLLGIVKPYKGNIEIAGSPIEEILENEEFKLGYVPQNVTLIEGTLRENMIFGFSANEFSDEEIWLALEKAELMTDFQLAGWNLETPLGHGGNNISGGQKQRLGIARALLLNPRILVMDEATSALDSETEEKLNKTIARMKGSTTLVIIAHRLSSVMGADKVIYLENGKLVHCGRFGDVRVKVPNFDNQAKLMGL